MIQKPDNEKYTGLSPLCCVEALEWTSNAIACKNVQRRKYITDKGKVCIVTLGTKLREINNEMWNRDWILQDAACDAPGYVFASHIGRHVSVCADRMQKPWLERWYRESYNILPPARRLTLPNVAGECARWSGDAAEKQMLCHSASQHNPRIASMCRSAEILAGRRM